MYTYFASITFTLYAHVKAGENHFDGQKRSISYPFPGKTDRQSTPFY